jgi:ketosteroid isomerase-like protein
VTTNTGLANFIEAWIADWNAHDLDAVLAAMCEDVVFEHWTGAQVRGKRRLELAWRPWFANHGNFRFDIRGICVAGDQSAASFEWTLDWPQPGGADPAVRERLEGIDCIRMRDGLVAEKRSYIRTASIAARKTVA